MAWTDHPYRYIGYFYFDRPSVLVKARVNQASFTHPLAQVTIDTITVGSSADFSPGLTVLFGSADGLDDLGRTYLRRNSTSTTLYIGESSNGIRDGELNLADNAYVTVLNDRRVWTVPPRIDDDENIYKFYDQEFEEAGRNYGERPGPIANGGPFKIGRISTGTGLATFQFSAADAYMVTSGSSKAGQTWDVQDGTITVGTATSEDITATFPIGRRYVTLEVEDSEGDTHIRYILVVALSLTDVTWKPIFDFEIVNHRKSADGHEIGVIIHEDIAPITFPDGSAVFYFEREFYNEIEGNTTGPISAENIKFVGWSDIEREGVEATFEGLQRGVEIRCISTAERLRRLNLLPQQVENDNTPDDWTEMLDLNDHRLMFYLLKWHSTALDVAPMLFNENDIAPVSELEGWNTSAADLYSQIDEVARARGGRFTCDQHGQLRKEYDPNLQNSGSRTATVIVALTADMIDGFTIERDRHPRDYWIDGSGITISDKPVFCIAPGAAPGQGAQRSDFSRQIVESQAELNNRTGHYYAAINSPYLPISLTLHNWGDNGLDPALMTWIEVTIASSTNRRARSFTDQRCLPVEVSIGYEIDQQTGTRSKRVEVTAIIETEGQPATTVIHPKGNANYPPIIVPVITFPVMDFEDGSFARGIGTVAAFDTTGIIYRTANFFNPSASSGPTWTTNNISATINSNIIDVAIDHSSPLYLGTGTTVNCWMVTQGVAQGIYKITDLFGACTIALKKALRRHTVSTSQMSIAAPFKLGSTGRVYAAYRTRAGVYHVYSTDDSTYAYGPQPVGGVSVGASLEAFSIPVTSIASVTTATSLTNGVNYLLRVSGTATLSVGLLMDAVYREVTTPGNWVINSGASESNLAVNSQINVDNTICVSNVFDGATHIYDFIIRGAGATITLGASPQGISGSWSAELFPFNYPVGTINAPGLHGSSKTDGLVYVSAFAGAAGEGYSSSNHGSSFSALGTPDIAPDDDLAACVLVPFDNNDNEYLVYHGAYDTTGTVRKLIRIETDGTTKTDISPSVSGTKYGPRFSAGIAVYPQDRRYLACFGINGAATLSGSFVSRDAGSSWNQLPSNYGAGCFSSNDFNVLYLWRGPSDAEVAYSEDMGVTIDSRVGNVDMGTIVAMIGG